MDIFLLFSFTAGLTAFLFGMTVMGDGLRALGGSAPRELIGRLCRTPLRGVLLGAGITALIQSSSAATVMVIGFVNSGIMSFGQSVGVIMGSNLGTTVTSWLLSLTGVGGGWLRLFNPSVFAPVLAVIGIIFIMGKKNGKRRHIGYVFLGFNLLIMGLDYMSRAAEPLSELPGFASALTVVSNPVLGLLGGALLTALIQSSSAAIGILGALTSSGALTVGAVIPVIMGQNIGTCVTTLLSGLGASKNARCASFIHFYFNVLGAALQLIPLFLLRTVFGLSILDQPADITSVAVIHTLFNLISLAVLLPFHGLLEKLALISAGEGKKAAEEENGLRHTDIPPHFEGCRILDDRFLAMPAFALTMCRAACMRMCEIVTESLVSIGTGDAGRITENCKLLAGYSDGIRQYLSRLAAGRVRLGDGETELMIRLLAAVGEIGRMGELAREAMKAAASVHDTENGGEPGRELADLSDAAVRVCRSAFLSLEGSGSGQVRGMTEELALRASEMSGHLRQLRIEGLMSGTLSVQTSAALDGAGTAVDHIIAHAERIASMRL